MASSSASGQQPTFVIHIEYSEELSEDFRKSAYSFFKDSNTGSSVKINWVRREATAAPARTVRQQNTGINKPRGYKNADNIPVLHGDNHCRECLCSPCVTGMPPTFLRGMCGPHAANRNKRYELYSKFWGTLKDLGLWRDEEYLRRKENRTGRADRREIIPTCIIQEIRRRYPSSDGNYTDYKSTFDAS